MGDVIHCSFATLPQDGGKARMRRRREHRLTIAAREILAQVDDLVMDHADPGICPVILTPALYDAARDMGEDMSGYLKQDLIPVV